MMLRRQWIPLVLAFLAVVANSTPAGAETLAEELRLEIAFQERQRQSFRELLGESRWQRLREARFDYELYEYHLGPQLDDLPHKREELTDSLLHCTAKLWRETLERRMKLEDRRDRLRHKMRGKRAHRKTDGGLAFSPRVRVGSRSSLGVKVHLRGARSEILRGLAFRLERDVGGPDLNLKLTYDSERARAFVVFHADHHNLGRTGAAGLRLTF